MSPATSVRDQRWIENRPTKGFRALDVRELWAYRELAAFLALRDLKVRYKQAAFGAAWAVFQPVVRRWSSRWCSRASRECLDLAPYPLFAYPGDRLDVLSPAAFRKRRQALVAAPRWSPKVYFPRLLVPLAAVVPGLIDLRDLARWSSPPLIPSTAPTWGGPS